MIGVLLATTLVTVTPLHAQGSDALTGDLVWRNIGPANMAGRITDIDALDDDFTHVVMAAASGGVWKSTNAGTTWESIFEDYGTANIGDVAIFQPDPDIIWVGTGESCTRNSVGWGDGVYKSVDGGKSFRNMGLREAHHISEVVVHPTNPDIVYVAAQGHLWGHGGDQGIFMTTDGGEHWVKLTRGLPDDGRTGASDLKMDPTDPQTLYAGMWERIRRPHNFESGGPNGGLFKSTDGGVSWTKLTTGLPEGDIGKVGVTIYRKDPSIVMAIVEHGNQPGPQDEGYDDLTQLGSGIYRSEDGGESWALVNRNNYRPFYFSHLYLDPNDDQRVFYLAGGAEISEDGGRTFTRTMDGIAGDFHALWVDPTTPDRFYVANDKGGYVTFDGGERYVMFDNMDLGQFYAVDVDMRDPYWVCGGLQDNGNWCGPSNSRDWNGILNDHWFKFHSGDGFHTTVDPTDWRTVYTEAQGGNIRRLDAVNRQVGGSIRPNPGNILNFDEIVPGYAGNGGQLPPSFRFNWSSPLVLSPHDPSTVLFGGNHLFRSRDKGDTWTIISPDLSTNRPELTERESGGLTRDVTGAEVHATIITVMESPIRAGLIWAGTDDGRLHVTRDDGATWTDVSGNLPEEARGLWVSRVEPSRFVEGRAYVSVDGHRSDVFRPMIYRTEDYGGSWTGITAGIPEGEPVYVVREDLRNPDLLFAGTEFAVHLSMDGGANWSRLMTGLPTVPVHDLVIHPRDMDLVAGTHGRSVWILDDITPLQQMNASVEGSALHVFENRTATLWRGISRGATRGHHIFQGRNPPSIETQPPGNSPNELRVTAPINFWSRSGGEVEIVVADVASGASFTQTVEAREGVNRWFWPIRFDPTEEEREAFRSRMEELREQFGGQVPGFFRNQGAQGRAAGAGTYRVTIRQNGVEAEGTITVRNDPGVEGVLPSVR